VAALIGGGLVLAAAPSDAGTGIELGVAKSKSGPFEEQVRRKVALGKKRNVYIRAKNRDTDTLDANLFSPDEADDYKFKYFKSNGTNITGDVLGSGYAFTVAEGKAKKFRMLIKAKDGTAAECVYTELFFEGGGDVSAAVAINLPPDTLCVI
jgi:hypothetical protein